MIMIKEEKNVEKKGARGIVLRLLLREGYYRVRDFS